MIITNHGVHQWDIVPGLPDTGGQNVFVNQFTHALARCGFKITIVNRGGYPHPNTDVLQTGLRYKDQNQRILYITDDRNEFVRKEDMHEQIPALVRSLDASLTAEGSKIDLIISHYWDGAKIGALYNETLPERLKHIWVPHSLAALKKRNIQKDKWANLRIDERLTAESELIQRLDCIAATSSTIRKTLVDDYGYTGPDLFLPPCVDIERIYPRTVPDGDHIWDFLSQRSGLSKEEVQGSKIITEVSRTDTTKRKDVLIKAFVAVLPHFPNSLLVVSIDEKEGALFRDLTDLIAACGAESRIAVIGSIWDLLPVLYAVTDVYCTPSVMEGFGMSAQEAAASKVPVLASSLVPFVAEYLSGETTQEIYHERHPGTSISVGDGAVIVDADDVDGFAFGLEFLLSNEQLRLKMGENAYHRTIPYFTWQDRIKDFLAVAGIEI